MKRTIQFIAAGLMALSLTLHFSACTEQSPLKSNDITTSTKRAPGELNILKSKSGVSLNKLFVQEKLITVAEGGKIEVGDKEHGESELEFKSGDVSQDVLVTFFWESAGLLQGGAEFSPHGTTFNNPVQVKLSYKDADLTGINEQDIKIWYFNEIEGVWELIASDVNTETKHVKGHLEHFSRYAIGTE